MNPTDTIEQYLSEFDYSIYSCRLKTFENWPFGEPAACTPAKMAAAGFVYCPTDSEPDAVKCFMCHKELDGWEPSDSPMAEHRKHSPKCPFLTMTKDKLQMTNEEVLKMELQRNICFVQAVALKKCKELQAKSDATAEKIRRL